MFYCIAEFSGNLTKNFILLAMINKNITIIKSLSFRWTKVCFVLQRFCYSNVMEVHDEKSIQASYSLN